LQIVDWANLQSAICNLQSAMRDSIRNRPMKLPRPTPYRSLLLVVALVVLALLLLVLDQAGMLGSLRGQAQSLLSPALRGLSQVGNGLSGVGQGLSDAQRLSEENAALREENSQLKAQIIKDQPLEQEVARLRQQLRIESDRPWKLLGADVSTHTPDAGRRVLILAVGSDQGVKPGMAVISKEGSGPPALIGVVEEVGARSASVLLITDFSSSVSAQVYHSGTIADGIVQGQWQRGSRLLLEQIQRAVPLAQGDIVVTAGLSAQFDSDLPRAAIPKNVPIGMIETFHADGYSQAAELRPFADPDQVRYAWVILSQDG
jgi:rod shape-determining protein MreC